MKKAFVIIVLLLASAVSGTYLGTWNIDEYVTITATTHQFSSGSATDVTGTITMRIYEDDNDVQLETLSMAKFDSNDGLYEQKTQLTAAKGYQAGKHYTVIIKATVDGVTAITTKNFQILGAVDTRTVLGNTPLSASVIGDKVVADMDANSTHAGDALVTVQLDHLVGVDTTVAAGGDLSTYVVDGSILSHLFSNSDTSDYNSSVHSLVEMWLQPATDFAAVPGDDATREQMLNWLYKRTYTKEVRTETESHLFDVDGVKIAEAELTDAAGVFTRTEYGAPD